MQALKRTGFLSAPVTKHSLIDFYIVRVIVMLICKYDLVNALKKLRQIESLINGKNRIKLYLKQKRISFVNI